MKFLPVCFAVFVTAQAVNPTECLSNVDPDFDYFPDKVSAVDSKLWTVSYHNTYKVLRNIDSNSSYLLYQCGTTPPADSNVYDEVIQIPIAPNVAIDEVVHIPMLEQLGQVQTIDVFLTDPQYISSPCFRDKVTAGEVLLVDRTEGNTSPDLLLNQPSSPERVMEVLQNVSVAFVSPFHSDIPGVDTYVKISFYAELTNAAIFEWIKFYSTFFNLEAMANEAVEAAADRYKCVTENAGRIQADFPQQPTVLWAYYSDYCLGWSVAKCPNYYCEFASACSAQLVSDDDESQSYSVDACGTKFMNVTELVSFGKDADHWIFPAPNWDETYVEFETELSVMKSVQNKRVFDYLGAGPNTWYEERYASYYDVVQDFCSVVGTTSPLPGGRWFRNVFQHKEGQAGECTSEGEHSILPYNFECDQAVFDLPVASPVAAAPAGEPVAESPMGQPAVKPSTGGSVAETPSSSSSFALNYACLAVMSIGALMFR
jgi:iron complex transport system substrate-binding protein